MNRTDRLLAIVLELQARGRQRAEDLATTFGVGKRTIYRDIQALCEAGVPVVAMPGQGYSLVDSLVFISGGWHMVAHDHARRARRNFRVSRMSELAVLPQEFERPVDFVLEQRPEDDRRWL